MMKKYTIKKTRKSNVENSKRNNPNKEYPGAAYNVTTNFTHHRFTKLPYNSEAIFGKYL